MYKIRTVFAGLTFLFSIHANTSAQTVTFSGNSVPAYIDQLPNLPATPQEAYTIYYPKGKKTIYSQYETAINNMLNDLAGRSNHQSRILSMLSGRYESESQRYDFSKVQIKRDPALEQALHQFTTDFYARLDDYLRAVSRATDSLRTGNQIVNAEKELALYHEQLPPFKAIVKILLSQLDNTMRAKGYNAVLEKSDTTNPFFIQMLEARGLMLEKIKMLLQQIDGASQSATSMEDYCRKNPGECK